MERRKGRLHSERELVGVGLPHQKTQGFPEQPENREGKDYSSSTGTAESSRIGHLLGYTGNGSEIVELKVIAVR